jgi:hypothetical protein
MISSTHPWVIHASGIEIPQHLFRKTDKGIITALGHRDQPFTNGCVHATMNGFPNTNDNSDRKRVKVELRFKELVDYWQNSMLLMF